MAKAELKTKENEASVEDFLNTLDDENARNDCEIVSQLMQKATKAKPKMWGANIVGFGTRLLKYDSGRELDWLVMGFSPRKANLTLYGVKLDETLLTKLGKYKTGKGCLYVKRLSDVDLKILEKMINNSAKK